ncbi:hypothetical protein ACFE04_021949 [Oxalis oulophora]
MFSPSILSRASRSVGRRSALLLLSKQQHKKPLHILTNQFIVHDSPKYFTSQVSLFHNSAYKSGPFQFGFSSSASPEHSEKENGNTAVNNDSESVKPNGDSKESDSDDEVDLSPDDLRKLIDEKEKLMDAQHEEIMILQDKSKRAYAELENVVKRTKREAESSKKFAIQNFAKGLLDVADNLGRASSSVKDSLKKIDESKDEAGAVSVFRKFGIEKFDPLNEPFDPHRHNAMFQVPDASKPPGTICHILKSGYILHDRVIRPAEVGVTQEIVKPVLSLMRAISREQLP